jgi:site-specific recombinase XerD
MESLKYEKVKGLSIVCNHCKSTIHVSHKPKKNCNHPPDKQRYRIVLKKPEGGRLVKVLQTRSLSVARNIAKEVVDSVKSSLQVEEHNALLLDDGNFLAWLMAYGDYLENIDVPRHRHKKRSDKYIKETLQSIKMFLVFCKDQGIAVNRLKVWGVNDELVGAYWESLEKRGNSNSTINRRIKDLRAFYNYLVEKKAVKDNIWQGFRLKSTSSTNRSISLEEFLKLVYGISSDGASKRIGGTSRNMFREWLVDLVRLKAYTGLRDEELFFMTWDMVEFENNQPVVICSPNRKVNKAKNNFKQEEYEYNYIPVGEELRYLLSELGLREKKSSNDYIVATNELRTPAVIRQFQNSINFFFNKLIPGKSLRGKFCRHTYATAINIYLPNISLTHASFRTTEKHYLDKKQMAIQIGKSNFRVYPKHTKDSWDGLKCTSLKEKQDTLKTKKGTQSPESLAVVGGRYWVRTSDPLLVRQVL